VTVLGLAVLIAVLAPAGSAHFNPLITTHWLRAHRGTGHGGDLAE
jgi:hypothetical protein